MIKPTIERTSDGYEVTYWIGYTRHTSYFTYQTSAERFYNEQLSKYNSIKS